LELIEQIEIVRSTAEGQAQQTFQAFFVSWLKLTWTHEEV
jgi:hypothetical protein